MSQKIPKNTKILVVDDSEIMRSTIIHHLKRLEFTDWTEACDGDEAFKLLSEEEALGQPFELVLCDYNMPGTNGLDLLRLVRKKDSFKDLPFVIISSYGEQKLVLQAVMESVSQYLVKPFSIEEFEDRITQGWEKHHQNT